MRRWLALGAAAIATAGAALALAQDGGAPAAPTAWVTRPEVPGTARTLVPFGIEATSAGPRAWALGRVDDATVVLSRAPSGAWSSTPLAAGRPVGGDAPQHAGELTPDGHGAVLLAAPTRLFTRAPGGAFTAAPDPGPALAADEQLVGGDPAAATARTLLAVVGGEDPAVFLAPTIADGTGSAVLRLDADGWEREPIDAPDPVRPLALAAAGPSRAWLLGSSAGRVVLLLRDAATERWAPIAFDDALLSAAATVEVAPPPADPLTATADGVWLDLRVTPTGATAPVDLTERLKLATTPDVPTPTASVTATATSTATATATATATTTATATATSTATPTGTPVAPSLVLDGRWCDVQPLCDHALGFTFAPGARGYRSVATAATAEAKFGTRAISAPVDRGTAADARARDAQRQGGYAALEGETFRLRDGIGDDGSSTTQAIAFAADGTGFTGGTEAVGAVGRAPAAPAPPAEAVPVADALTTAALSPVGDGRVFAASRSRGAVIFEPGNGWSPAFSPLLEIFAPPIAIAWPRRDIVIAGGSSGLLATSNREPFNVNTDFFEDEDIPNPRITNFEELEVRNTVLAIACTPTDPLDCVAVGLNGLIARGDGFRWRLQALPDAAPEPTHVTGVAFDERTPLLATTDGLYVASGDGYARDEDLRARMTAAGLSGAVRTVATVAGGGVVVDGRFARDSAGAAWRPTAAPLALHPYALGAYRDADGAVRAIVSATSDPTPLPEPIEPEPDTPPEDGVPPRERNVIAPSPVDAVTLRETADGWLDLDRSRFQRSGGRDLPDMTPNTRTILVDSSGTGMLLGGVSDASTGSPYRDGPDAQTLGGVPSARRLEGGVLAPPQAPPSESGENPAPPATVRLAVGGHPACLDRCGGAGGQGYAPDTHLQTAIARVRAMTAAGAGPAALLIGGGRASVGGEPLDPGGARRYRELTDGAGVPTYVLPGPGDLPGGGAEAFASAFATAPAPQGTGETPAGVDLVAVTQPGGATPGQGRGTFAFDVKAPAGTVRVIAIDNAAGRLAGGPEGPQAQWIRATLDQARTNGVPSVVVGSAPLDDTQHVTPAEDAADQIALLAGKASAYVATAGVDDPADEHFGGVLSQSVIQAPGVAPLTLLQSSTLGYAPSYKFTRNEEDEDDIRQTNAALLLIDVAVGQLDPGTGVAPVATVAEPLLEGLDLDRSSRSVPLGWAFPLFVTARDPSPRRFLMSPEPGAPLRPAGPSTTTNPLIDQCRFYLQSCASLIPTDMTFVSANPRIARFVAVRPGGRETEGLPQVVLDASGHVIDDPRGFVCPLALGNTDVYVTAMGRRVTTPIRVIPVPKIDGLRATSIPPGTCAFPILDPTPNDPKPTPTPQPPAADPAPPATDPAPVVPDPQPQPQQPSQPAPQPAPNPAPPAPNPGSAGPAPAAPVRVTPPVADAALPPVAPAPKPPVTAPPPTPPQGLSVQAVEAPQVQTFQALQHAEQRREEYAFDTDSAAVAYAQPPSPLPWEIAGGVAALLLVMAGGGVAGRARSRAAATAKATARR